MVVGEGFEPSKLSRQSYSLLGLTAPQPHQVVQAFLLKSVKRLSPKRALPERFLGMVPAAGVELATY